jgi:hypothetical protein
MKDKILIKGNLVKFNLGLLTDDDFDLIEYLKDNKFERIINRGDNIENLDSVTFNSFLGVLVDKNLNINIDLREVSSIFIEPTKKINKDIYPSIEYIFKTIDIYSNTKDIVLNFGEDFKDLDIKKLFFIFEDFEVNDKKYRVLKNIFYFEPKFIIEFLKLNEFSDKDISEINFNDFKNILKSILEEISIYNEENLTSLFLEKIDLLKINSLIGLLISEENIERLGIGSLYDKTGNLLK